MYHVAVGVHTSSREPGMKAANLSNPGVLCNGRGGQVERRAPSLSGPGGALGIYKWIRLSCSVLPPG